MGHHPSRGKDLDAKLAQSPQTIHHHALAVLTACSRSSSHFVPTPADDRSITSELLEITSPTPSRRSICCIFNHFWLPRFKDSSRRASLEELDHEHGVAELAVVLPNHPGFQTTSPGMEEPAASTDSIVTAGAHGSGPSGSFIVFLSLPRLFP